jgi:D-tyrosyl-tRNA(Tyr) deacylase
VGEIGSGLLVYLAVGKGDTREAAQDLANKIANLRIFDDGQGKMSVPLAGFGKSILVVSEFTLYGDCRKGRRPNYMLAAPPDTARELYEAFVAALRSFGLEVATGEFQATMEVESLNDGPVTLLLDSEKLF